MPERLEVAATFFYSLSAPLAAWQHLLSPSRRAEAVAALEVARVAALRVEARRVANEKLQYTRAMQLIAMDAVRATRRRESSPAYLIAALDPRAAGAYVRRRRAKLGLAQDAFGAKVGLDESQVGLLERGLLPFTPALLKALSRILEVPPAALLTGSCGSVDGANAYASESPFNVTLK